MQSVEDRCTRNIKQPRHSLEQEVDFIKSNDSEIKVFLFFKETAILSVENVLSRILVLLKCEIFTFNYEERRETL